MNSENATQRRIGRCMKKCGWEPWRKSHGKHYWKRVTCAGDLYGNLGDLPGDLGDLGDLNLQGRTKSRK